MPRLSILASVFTLALVEVFFQANAHFFWINPPFGVDSARSFKDPPDPLGSDDHALCEVEVGGKKSTVRGPLRWVFERPNCMGTAHLYLKHSRRLVYSTAYRSDARGWRPVPGTNPASRKPIFFFGCSYTYGVGVDESETFPARFGAALPDRHVYNFGMPGAAPNKVLGMLQGDSARITGDFGSGGLAIYTYIPDHVPRALGTMSWISWWQHDQGPYFRDVDGKLADSGTFASGRPILTPLLKFLGRSETLKFFSVDLPPIGDAQLDFFAQLIAEIRQESRARLGVEKFVFVFFPGAKQFHAPLVAALKKRNIDYIDYSDLDPSAMLKETAFIPGDGHPTAATYRLYADLLAKDLRIRGYLE